MMLGLKGGAYQWVVTQQDERVHLELDVAERVGEIL